MIRSPGRGPVSDRLQAEVASGRLQADIAQAAAARRLDALCDALRRKSSRLPWFGAAKQVPRGLYLWGGVGRGKTLLMDLFFAAAGGTAAERTHFYRFMRDVHSGLAAARLQTDPLQRVAERIASRTRVICLDEFIVADIADAMILAGLFAGLFRRGVILVATSNLPPAELYKDGLQRQRFLPAIDLILEHVDVLHLDGGTDYRLRTLRQAPTYLDAAAPGTPAALEARFAAISGGLAAGPSTIGIEGRELNALNRAPGSIWFSFAELCAGARSQNDYIELARRFDTLFVTGIPVFEDAGDDDAARRFIMLIDELYDRRVKLVVSAAAAPVSLYRGERLRFEFERAASRLIEMQTDDYLAGQHRP
jgi:cell division protein ZapE